MPAKQRKDSGQSEEGQMKETSPIRAVNYGRQDDSSSIYSRSLCSHVPTQETRIQGDGRRHSGRSWHDSTISALDRVLDGTSEDWMVV
jgi:hypothetical protein